MRIRYVVYTALVCGCAAKSAPMPVCRDGETLCSSGFTAVCGDGFRDGGGLAFGTKPAHCSPDGELQCPNGEDPSCEPIPMDGLPDQLIYLECYDLNGDGKVSPYTERPHYSDDEAIVLCAHYSGGMACDPELDDNCYPFPTCFRPPSQGGEEIDGSSPVCLSGHGTPDCEVQRVDGESRLVPDCESACPMTKNEATDMCRSE